MNKHTTPKVADDPLADVAAGCAQIMQRIEDYAISPRTCEEVGELESYHDALAREVRNLASLLQIAVQAISQGEAE